MTTLQRVMRYGPRDAVKGVDLKPANGITDPGAAGHGYVQLFPFHDFWWFYLLFAALIAILLALDLSASRKMQAVSMRTAAGRALIWVMLGLSFSCVVYLLATGSGSERATQAALEYLAGYLVEESLSVDNLFVFALLFRYFAVTGESQSRVLLYGILGAMLFRGLFVAAGSALIRFEWVVTTFGVLLVLSAARMAFAGEQDVAPERNLVVRLARRFLPVSDRACGSRFVVREDGALRFTPLMIVLLAVESTDVLFAVDSVPAVFAVTREPLIVYTSNVFAILGLRAMFLVLSGILDRFYLLRYGLAAILGFVGLKMVVLDRLAGGRLSVLLSLGVIAGAVAASVVLSLLFPRRSPVAERSAEQIGKE